MKKVIRLTESDLTRIVKRVINENDKKIFFLRRLGEYNFLIDYEMETRLRHYCNRKDYSREELKKEYIKSVKNSILDHIDKSDFLNQPRLGGFSEDVMKFEEIFNQLYLDKIKNYFDENCTEKNKPKYFMKYFEKIKNKIQKLVLEAMEHTVDPDSVQSDTEYLIRVLNYVWLNLDKDENTPSEYNFEEFMFKYFVKQILNYYNNLKR